jgi:hypothetical protein
MFESSANIELLQLIRSYQNMLGGYDLIKKNAKVIVDTRGVYGFNVENVVKA